MSSILDSVVPTSAPSISSFGAGGQMYIADMFTGFNISAERTNQLFAFAETDNSVPNAEFLTNLTEARKIGSTMDFKALQIGLRVVPTGDAPLTAAQVAAAKSLLASAKVKITLGSNQTIVGEFSETRRGSTLRNLSEFRQIVTLAVPSTLQRRFRRLLPKRKIRLLLWLCLPVSRSSNRKNTSVVTKSAPRPSAGRFFFVY